MTEKRIQIPEGMLKAVEDSYKCRRGVYSENATRADLEAALRWFIDEILHEKNVEFHRAILAAEEERFPSPETGLNVIARRVDFEYGVSFARNYLRRMFLAPEPEVPEEIKDLLFVSGPAAETDVISEIQRGELDKRILEAFSRGAKKGSR